MNHKIYSVKSLAYSNASFLMVSLFLLTACQIKPVDELPLQVLVDYGDYASLKLAENCEEDVDWTDQNLEPDTQCSQAFAAQELQQHLSLLTGGHHSPEVIKPWGAKFNRPSILLLTQQQWREYWPQARRQVLGKQINQWLANKTLPEQSYWLKSFQRNGHRHLLIVGADRAATLYGVYGFLESLGVRWYAPEEASDAHRFLPSLVKIEIPVVDKVEQPGFLTRGFWAKDDRGHEAFFNWMARNRINLWSYAQPEKAALRKRGFIFLTGGHMVQKNFLDPDAQYPFQSPGLAQHQYFPADPFKRSGDYMGDTNRDGILSYSEAHPEWYGLVNQQRLFDVDKKYGTNFCSSNGDAVKMLSQNFIHDLIQGAWSEADIINFWPVDVGHWCECSSCQALGSPTDRMLIWLHQTRQYLDKAYSEGRLNRRIILTAPAYLETRRPPSKPLPEKFDYDNNILTFFPIERCYAHSFNDRQCRDVNHHHNQDLKSWLAADNRHYRGTLFFGEYYNISLLASLPMIFTRVMAEDIPYYYTSGIRHMHYMHAETVNWGTMTLTNYQFAKMLWQPDINVEAFINELYVQYYGDAAETYIKAFYRHLENAMSSMKTIRWAGKSFTDSYSLDDRLKRNEPDLFVTDHLKYESHQPDYNDGRDILEMVNDIARARDALNNALRVSQREPYKGRLKAAEKRFAYGEAMVYFYDYLIQTHRAHHSHNTVLARKAFAKVQYYASQLKAMTDIIQVVGGTLKAGDGFTATFNVETYNRYRTLYGGGTGSD